MNDNVRKVFNILGVEPNKEFEVIAGDNIDITYKFKFDENLQGYYFSDEWCYADDSIRLLLNGYYKIIKFPKEPKKKLRDLTAKEYDKWLDKNCGHGNCNKCIFANVTCYRSFIKESWIRHKDLYSDKFLDQEIEVVE